VRSVGSNQSLWRLVILGIGAIFSVVMLIRWTHHRRSVADATSVDHTQAPEDDAAASTPPKMSPLSPRLAPNCTFNRITEQQRPPSVFGTRLYLTVGADAPVFRPVVAPESG
jgi:hypothetical protein